TGEPFPPELLLRLKHMILSHHGSYEFGSPKLPMTPEAIFLNCLDNLDAKVHSFTRDIQEDKNQTSAWTPFNQALQRRLYKGTGNGRERSHLAGVETGGVMPTLAKKILAAVGQNHYQPLKPKALARKLEVPSSKYAHFKETLRNLVMQRRVEIGKNHTIRLARPHGTVTGIYRRTSTGLVFVRPHMTGGHVGPDILIGEASSLDPSTGDEVLARITRKPNRRDLSPAGEVLRVLERATRQFVG